jgi:CubicO group peptidase (beta-lactamase class C family)
MDSDPVVPIDPGDWEAARLALRELAATGGFSGTVLVMGREGPLLEESHGLADCAQGTPIHSGTRFGLASLSKMFTAVAVLSAAGDGLLEVEDRVVDLLPAGRRPRSMDDRVTVHHLLCHTSGIGDYFEEDENLPGFIGEDYALLWRDRPSYRMERPDDYLPLYDDRAPVSPPGTGFHYSNAGYVLLAAVLEEADGAPFVDAVTRRVLLPAGMARSGYLRLDEAHPDVATGYLPAGRGHRERSNIYSVPVIGSGDGGCLSPARDIDRLLRAIASGDLLGGDLTAAMLARHAHVKGDLWWGYGCFLRPGLFGHGGGDPGVEVLCRHLPERGLTLVVLCNVEGVLDGAWRLLDAAAAGTDGSGSRDSGHREA